MKSTFRILFYLRKKESKKTNLASVMVRITINGEKIQFSSNVEVEIERWDQKAGKVTGRTTFIKKKNDYLELIKTQLYKHYFELLQQYGEVPSPLMLRDVFFSSGNERNLIYQFSLFNREVKEKASKSITHKTYTRYELTKKRLIEFMEYKYEIKDIKLSRISLEFIDHFFIYLQERHHCSHNTAMKFIQRFRTVLNNTVYLGLLNKNPFEKYKICFQKTSRIYLNQDEINKIWNKKFSTRRLEQVRDVFIFACYSGLSFIDLCGLTQANIELGFDNRLWIKMHRQKTKQPSNIPLLKIPLLLLKKYKKEYDDEPIFPISSNQKMNEYLKEIADLCGVTKKLTTHVARHSFATFIMFWGNTLYYKCLLSQFSLMGNG